MNEEQKTKAATRKPRSGKAVYERIREMAISYVFLPDTSINEASLADTLGVSRSPVRDALNRLATEGLLSYRTNHGFFARSLSEQELFDLAEARMCLELEALDLAFERATDQQRRDLLHFWQEVDAGLVDTKASETARADEAFHMLIFEMSSNRVLIDLIKMINARIRFIREIEVETPIREGADFREHINVANALISNDRDDGLAAMKRHLTFDKQNTGAILRAGIVRVYQTRS